MPIFANMLVSLPTYKKYKKEISNRSSSQPIEMERERKDSSLLEALPHLFSARGTVVAGKHRKRRLDKGGRGKRIFDSFGSRSFGSLPSGIFKHPP
jgi:hypothetical protein